jgi:hypothetical protein
LPWTTEMELTRVINGTMLEALCQDTVKHETQEPQHVSHNHSPNPKLTTTVVPRQPLCCSSDNYGGCCSFYSVIEQCSGPCSTTNTSANRTCFKTYFFKRGSVRIMLPHWSKSMRAARRREASVELYSFFPFFKRACTTYTITTSLFSWIGCN